MLKEENDCGKEAALEKDEVLSNAQHLGGEVAGDWEEGSQLEKLKRVGDEDCLERARGLLILNGGLEKVERKLAHQASTKQELDVYWKPGELGRTGGHPSGCRERFKAVVEGRIKA